MSRRRITIEVDIPDHRISWLLAGLADAVETEGGALIGDVTVDRKERLAAVTDLASRRRSSESRPTA